MHTGQLITDLEQLVDQIFAVESDHTHNCSACGNNYECFDQLSYCGFPRTAEDSENLCPECRVKFDDGEIEL